MPLGQITIPHAFVAVTTVTGQQFDDNFNALATAIDSPFLSSNYLVDTGSANTYTVAFGTGIVPSYTAGLQVQMLVSNTNTIASTLNVNGLGVKNILLLGSALTAGAMVAGTIVLLQYDGTQFQLLNASTTTSVNTFAINGNQIGGYHNRAINSGFPISQINGNTAMNVPVGNGATTASWFGSAGAASQVYLVDGFYTLAAGTGAGATQQRIAGAGQDQYQIQITGATGITGLSFGQRIETANSYDLNGTTVSFSVELTNSLLTSVTWTAYYATTTADTWGIVGAYTRTQIATGVFTVSGALGTYSAQIAVPSAATKGFEIVLTVGAQTSGTWTIGEWQIEQGSVATAFEFARYDDQLKWCQRYLPVWFGAGTVSMIANGFLNSTSTGIVNLVHPVPTRIAPTNLASSALSGFHLSGATIASAVTVMGVVYNPTTLLTSIIITGTGTPYTANQPAMLYIDSAAGFIALTGCQL